MKSKWLGYMLVAAAVVCIAGAARAEDKETDREAVLRAMPGYVDFTALDGIKEQPRVEVNLRDPMLGLVSKFISEDDPDMRSLLASLKLVRVRIYPITAESSAQLLEIGSKTSKLLDKQGWERVVRVRDEGDHVDVYFKPSSRAEWIDGVLVIALGDDDEAVFVNIVGTIRPEDVSRLSEHMDIDGLDRVHVDGKVKVKN